MKKAFAAAKAKRVKLGCPTPMSDHAWALGRAKQREMAIQAYGNLEGYVCLMKQSGMSLRAIAQRLTNEGFKTRTGKEWATVQVSRLLQRSYKRPRGQV